MPSNHSNITSIHNTSATIFNDLQSDLFSKNLSLPWLGAGLVPNVEGESPCVASLGSSLVWQKNMLKQDQGHTDMNNDCLLATMTVT